MLNEKNNNETSKSKTNISPNDQDNITTLNNDNKNPSNLNSPAKSNKKELVVSLMSVDGKSSSKTLLNESKVFTNMLDSETIKTDTTNKDLLKLGLRKKSMRKKRKKGKKGKKSDMRETESILLTEVKQIPVKKEESESHKFLQKKLDNLNFAKNLQAGINIGFSKINEEIKDDLAYNYNINENKKTPIEKLVPKQKTNLKLNTNKNGIIYNISKESMIRLKQLKNDEKYIKYELNKIEENQKIMDSELPLKNDVVTCNNRKTKLKRIASMKNELLSRLKYNSIKISELIDSNKTINRNLLIKNYMSPDFRNKNGRNNNLLILNSMSHNHFCLSEDQEKFNNHLLQMQKEEQVQREKLQKDLKISSEKKTKELELKENNKIQRRKDYLKELKNKEKEFLSQIKEKNNLILEKSNKYIDEKNHKKMKDYLFYQFQKKFENSEKRLIEKVNMMKKDTLVTKKELEELANKREEQKKILEEGLNERKLKLIKMWKIRSQTLPIYKHPIVDTLEDEEDDLLDEEEDKKEQKEKNEKQKRNYQPPKVKIDIKLKEIRESRNIKTNKDSVTKTEINNKNRFLKNLDFMANIIEAAKEENIEKNKNKIKIKTKRDENMPNSLSKKNILYKSIEINENKSRPIYKLHPKPEKPIDYLKELIKQKRNKKDKIKVDVGVGDIFAGFKDIQKNKGPNQIIEALDMVKSKTNAIDRKVFEKKEYLKIKGGYINNTKLGDEVGNLLIESIQTKLSLLSKLNVK